MTNKFSEISELYVQSTESAQRENDSPFCPPEKSSQPSDGKQDEIVTQTATTSVSVEQTAQRENDSPFCPPEKKITPPYREHESRPETESADKESGFTREDLLNSDFELPSWIFHIIRVILLLIAVVALFFMTVQTASFLSSLRNLSRTEQILLAIPMIVFGGIILWYMGKILWYYWLFKRPMHLDAIKDIERRQKLQGLSSNKDNGKLKKAVEELKELLRDSYQDHKTVLKKYQVAPHRIKAMEKTRKQLIHDAENYIHGTSLDWISDFCRNYQSGLDEIASKRIRKVATHAGIMTGISPYPLIDRLIILASCVTIIKELMEIYALKPTGRNSIMLLVQVIYKIYISGFIDDAAANAAANGVELVKEKFPEIADFSVPAIGISGDVIANVAGKVVGKAGGMLTQTIMVYRLGLATQKMLRPVNPGK